MLRRLTIACAFLPLAVAAPARAQEVRSVVVLWVDGLALGEAVSGPLGAFVRGSSIALVSTRTANESTDPATMRANAAVTFGAGARAAGNAATGDPIPVDGATPGLLGEALARASVRAGVRADDPVVRWSVAEADGTLPAGSGRGPEVLVVQRPSAREAIVGPRSVVILVSPTPTVERQRQGIRLGFIAVGGAGIGPGLISSPTTRRPGVLSLTDVAPTILDLLRIPVPDGMDGRAAEFHAHPDAITALRALERDVIHAARARRPLTRGVLGAAMAAVVLAAAAIGGARGARRARSALGMLLLAAAAAPLGLYVEGVFPTDTVPSAVVGVAAFAIGAALLARATLGRQRGLLAILLATALVPLVDLLLGSPLGVRSPLSHQVAVGARFYGVGGDVLGLVVGATVVGVAMVLDRVADPRRTAPWVALALAGVVWILAAPAYGAKLGAAPTAVPAFGVLAARARGRRLSWKVVVVIALATLTTTAAMVAADALRSPETRSHVARAVGGDTDLTGVLGRKIAATWRITVHGIWAPAIAVFAGALGLLAWRRRPLLARGFWGRPMHRVALLAAGTGALAAIAFNDVGVVAATPIALYAAVTSLAVLLGPD